MGAGGKGGAACGGRRVLWSTTGSGLVRGGAGRGGAGAVSARRPEHIRHVKRRSRHRQAVRSRAPAYGLSVRPPPTWSTQYAKGPSVHARRSGRRIGPAAQTAADTPGQAQPGAAPAASSLGLGTGPASLGMKRSVFVCVCVRERERVCALPASSLASPTPRAVSGGGRRRKDTRITPTPT